MPFDLDYSDSLKLNAFLDDVERRLTNYIPFWNNYAAPLVQGETAEVFLTEGRGEWQPLHPAYAAAKEQSHPGKTILRRDDHYITAATSTSHPASIFEATETEMVMGVDGGWFDRRFGFDYPSAHELGIGVAQRQVYGKLTETGELEANTSRLLEKWHREEIAESERQFF